MAFAPLDVWLRLLFLPPALIPPRYWLRLAFALFTSFWATAFSLPERLLLAPILRIAARRSAMKLHHTPGVVVILGYFRSGTTHLHYLLGCDPNLRTPAWCETLAPQSYRLGWLFLRIFMIPWLSAKRPQDDVSIGPEWPAEDDFALNNWAAASSLPWRFILPSRRAHYARFHSLEGLTTREHRRWRFCQFAFCWKIARIAGKRGILLKSPSHIARVRELIDLFGAEHVKFIHISRDPHAVIKSNVSMFRRMSGFGLQDPARDEEVEPLLRAEYIHSEKRYLEALPDIPSGHIVELRYEDVVADPLGQIRAAYQRLGMQFTEDFERRALSYLNSVRDYRAATPGREKTSPASDAELDEIIRRFGHDRPAIPAAAIPASPPLPDRTALAIGLASIAAVIGMIAWIAQAWFLHNRHDWLAWPLGIAIGLICIRTTKAGTVKLGVVAAALVFIVFVAIAIPATFLSDYGHRPYYHTADGGWIPMKDWEWYHILKASRVGLLAPNNLFWGFMGCVTAYRFASRKHVHAPGSG